MGEPKPNSEAPVDPKKDYYSTYWWDCVKMTLQGKLLEELIPKALDENARLHWELVWAQRYAISFAKWAEAHKERFAELAERIDHKQDFTSEELRAIALELENF